ncbi:MAG: SH3 domain-containing protein [Bacteroides fragilis]|nr:SH3 domain-containing protein [Bacteroides fragilis]
MWIGRCAAAAVIFCGLAGAEAFSLYAKAQAGDGQAGAAQAQDAAGTSENGDSGELETYEQGMVLEAEKRVEMKAAPEETAETLMSFQKGSLVFAVGGPEDGWYRVIYQGNEGYVEEDALTALEIDIEGLNAEMAANEEETKFVVEVVEKYRADARRSKMWGTIIIVLVIGIFGVGIFSAVRGGRNEEAEKNSRKDAERNDDRDNGRKAGKGDGGAGRKKRKKESEKIEIEDLD